MVLFDADEDHPEEVSYFPLISARPWPQVKARDRRVHMHIVRAAATIEPVK